MVHVGLSLMIEEPFRRAVLPLFEDGLVDALEHGFEIGWGPAVEAGDGAMTDDARATAPPRRR